MTKNDNKTVYKNFLTIDTENLWALFLDEKGGDRCHEWVMDGQRLCFASPTDWQIHILIWSNPYIILWFIPPMFQLLCNICRHFSNEDCKSLVNIEWLDAQVLFQHRMMLLNMASKNYIFHGSTYRFRIKQTVYFNVFIKTDRKTDNLNTKI